MSHRRVNRSKKVPNVKLRPAAPNTHRDLRTPDSTWQHSSGLDSDEDTSRTDLCPRPFKGFILCATGIDDKTSLFKQAIELGAQPVSSFTDRVTHLLAEEPGSAKYRFALEHRIPIMRPSWITESHDIWLRGDDVDVPASVLNHRLPIFSGIILSVSGIEKVSRRMEINRLLTEEGGTYVKTITRPVRVTHLICGNESEDGESDKVRYARKFNQDGEADIKILWEDWFWDSLKFGGRFDEERYEVGRPKAPPRVLPEEESIPPSSSATDPSGLSSEIQQVETSAVSRARPSANANEDEEEIASVKRVPAVTLHLWESILKPRGFEVQDGRLVRSPSKSQVAIQQQVRSHREASPSRSGTADKAKDKLSRRGTLQAGAFEDDDARPVPKSALSNFQRARSFNPSQQHASTLVGARQQPFQRTATTVSRTSSFLQRSVGSIHAAGGLSAEVPIASTSAVAGPSSRRDGSEAPLEEEEDSMASAASEGLSEKGRTMFAGLKFRALGEARCAPVRRAIESAGGKWLRADNDEDADIVLVRLISGSSFYRQEADEGERAKYRTECWLERCLFEERLCAAGEHVALIPLKVQPPVRGAEGVVLSCSGLDQAEKCMVQRLLRALGVTLAPAFSRRSTHLLCPSGEGPKADKAREWGIPIVDMAWLSAIASTGEIPPVSAVLVAEGEKQAQVDGGALLDLNMLSQPLQGEDRWMASQPPEPKADVKGKGKATETMVDITNAHGEAAPRSQSLSYCDPPGPEEAKPGQAEQMETFGMPHMLLSTHAPATPRRPARASPNPNNGVRATQGVPSQENVSIPSHVHEGRIPSSTSPSPMRMPEMSTPQDSAPKIPARITKHATVIIQDRLTTLLGKRPPDGDDEGATVKGQTHESRLGKRMKPLQRTRSNVSCTDMLITPGQSPASVFAAVRSPIQPPEPDLLPQLLESGMAARKPGSSSGDEADNSFTHDDEETNESICVAYADPMQCGELDRLKFLLNKEAEEGRQGHRHKEGWELELEKMDVTLPQLEEVSGAGVRKPGRARRGRARRGARV